MVMDGDYIEGRFGIVMEEVRDALVGIENNLAEISKALNKFSGCVEDKTAKNILRTMDVGR